MREYQKPEIKRETFSFMDVIAVSTQTAIANEHKAGIQEVLTHDWKDSWN